jgi:hypothetical protein
MKFSVFIMMITATIFSGCAGKMPLTADEFRQMAPGATFGGKETFEVKRSVGKVAATFKNMASKCLNKRVKSVESGYMYHHVVVTKYTPTVKIAKNRAELFLQFEHEQGVMKVYDMPKKGYFLMVMDATGTGKNKTRIDFYRPSVGHKNIIEALRGWATGKNVGCPDLTK